MGTYVLRVWLPDRPGALGLVASRIGAVRGDVLSIEIIERDGGQAIDELVVELPNDELVPLMLSEIAEVDGVAVEDVWAVPVGRSTREAQMLDLVERLVIAETSDRLTVLCSGLVSTLDADWGVVLGRDPVTTLASHGEMPDHGWLSAFLDGARYMGESEPAPDDVAWVDCDRLTIAVGRSRWALRQSERIHLKQLARITSRLS
jgi:hypothetical protein